MKKILNLTKKSLLLLIVLAIVLGTTAFVVCSDKEDLKVQLYAVDYYTGAPKSAEFNINEVEAQCSEGGWYREPVRTLYAVDYYTGEPKKQVFKETEVEHQCTEGGWYKEPVARLYSADGRMLTVKQSEVAGQLTVGWYKTKQEAEDSKWAAKMAQYPIATQVWRKLKSFGWNDYVCAGILGNMMLEVGGGTFNLQWNNSSSLYYGLCQWGGARRTRIQGAGVEQQVEYIRTEFYQTPSQLMGYSVSSFLAITNEQTAANVFRSRYERGCGSAAAYATKALNYFAR